MDAGQLGRLEHVRALLPVDRVAGPPRLLLFSRSGFAAGLVGEAAARSDVELVDLERIYRGTRRPSRAGLPGREPSCAIRGSVFSPPTSSCAGGGSIRPEGNTLTPYPVGL